MCIPQVCISNLVACTGTITGTWYERTWEGPVKHGLNFETIKLHISITGTVHAHVTRPLNQGRKIGSFVSPKIVLSSGYNLNFLNKKTIG